MTLEEISKIRLNSQKISASEFKTAGELTSWMGAMQAQDYSMAKWAIGLRLKDSTDKNIEESFNKGEIIRTHLMRPTWHFISAEDIYWMLDLTALQIKASMKSRDKALELSDAVYKKSNSIIEKSLSAEVALTREELEIEFNRAGINTGNNRLSHIFLRAELDGIMCSGPVKGNKHTFSLLQKRVPLKKLFTREESLVKLAERYFRSHCPATIQDFAWWSGLSQKETLHAMESVKHLFISEKIDSGKYYFPASFAGVGSEKTSVHLLPAYDEFLISYRNRIASLPLGDTSKTVSANGIFYPLIVVNGQVTGLWKRSTKGNKVTLELILYSKHNRNIRELIGREANALGRFLNKETEVRDSAIE